MTNLIVVLFLDCLTTSLNAIKPFPSPPIDEPTLEVAEFPGSSERDLSPYVTFLNHLYIYPLSLSFESQKIFSRARNIAVTVEVRNSDEIDAKPLEVSLRNTKMKISYHYNLFLVHLSTTRSKGSTFCDSTFMPRPSS